MSLSAFGRGFVVGFAQTALFMVGVPLALLAMALDGMASLIGALAGRIGRAGDSLSDWRKTALLRELKELNRE